MSINISLEVIMSFLFTNLKNVIFLAFTMFFFSCVFAFAGTPALTIKEVDLRYGPGTNYKSDFIIEGGADVIVERCSNRWCLISNRSAKGWVSIDKLSFGNAPKPAFSGPKRDQILQGDGEICFYSGANFSGEAICSSTGMVVPDLALYGRDNSFASISVEGEISAMVCRDMKFSSYCETITQDQPVLSRFLKRAISSYRVW